MRRIKITYDIVTEESAKEGDFAANGWIDEEGETIQPDAYDLEEHEGELAAVVALSVNVITKRGSIEASSSHWHNGLWYSEIDSEMGEPRHAYHLDGFSEQEEQAIFNVLKR